MENATRAVSWDALRHDLTQAWLTVTPKAEHSVLELRILEQISRLIWYRCSQDKHAAPYTCASEKWVASRLGCSREAVSRHLSRLADRNLLQLTHRRPVNGRWSTNLYRLSSMILGRLAVRIQRRRPRPAPSSAKHQLSVLERSHVNQPAHPLDHPQTAGSILKTVFAALHKPPG